MKYGFFDALDGLNFCSHGDSEEHYQTKNIALLTSWERIVGENFSSYTPNQSSVLKHFQIFHILSFLVFLTDWKSNQNRSTSYREN